MIGGLNRITVMFTCGVSERVSTGTLKDKQGFWHARAQLFMGVKGWGAFNEGSTKRLVSPRNQLFPR